MSEFFSLSFQYGPENNIRIKLIIDTNPGHRMNHMLWFSRYS